jgi:urease accessory protein
MSAGAVACLLLADSRFPAGSYAHSLGLEQAVAEGLGVDGVAPFIDARLRLVAQPEAALSVAARRAAARGTAVTRLAAGGLAAPGGVTPGGVTAGGVTAGGVTAGGVVAPGGVAARGGLAAPGECAASAERSATGAREGALELAALDDEHAARCPSPILRDVARRLGSQLLRSAATAWPCATIDRYRADSTTTPRPVALGVVGAAAGLSDIEVAMVALYDDAATVACAALKLLGLDPAQTARWLADLAPRIGAVARELADDTRPVAQQLAPAAVGLELAAGRHAARTERLFVS